MNLIGHLACAKGLDAPGQLGSFLPDLLRLVARRPRPAVLLKMWEGRGAQPERGALPPRVAGLLAGVRFHFQVDSRFHAAPLFLQTTAALRHGMEEVSDRPGLKRFFAAHLLCELYYDHLLLAGEPGLGGRFYDLLENEGDLTATFAAIQPDFDRRALGIFLERMLRDRFVEDYRSHDGVLFRTNRVLRAMRQRALDDAEMAAMTLYFTSEAPRLAPPLLQFVQTMQRWSGDDAAQSAKLTPPLPGPGGERAILAGGGEG